MKQQETDVVIRLVGESGEGTVSLGDLTVQMLVSMGLDVYTFQTFPAEIKGGTVMYQIRAKSKPVLSQGDYADVVVALNAEGFDLYGAGLREDGILLYDSDSYVPTPQPNRTDYALPISTIAKAAKDAVRSQIDADQLRRLPPPKNIIGLGALLQLLNAPLTPAEDYLTTLFSRKGEAIVAMNIQALHSGAQHIAEQLGTRRLPQVFTKERPAPVMTVNGNQMVSLGAIAAGLGFFAGYPITPATEIMEQLAKDLPVFGGDMIQAEDEIAALGMAIGASFAGKKSMTSTSGPGLSLMVELINYAGQAEIPVVIVDVQRGGASTGMPTKTSQGDLNLALYGVHNESPRIVLAASSVEDCFWTTVEAFNLAEAYQCPVILLSDQAMSARKCTVHPMDPSAVYIVDRLLTKSSDGYQRFADTPSGISPMAIPGMPGCSFTSTGIEHDEIGDPGYTPELAMKMKRKRYRKFDTLIKQRGAEFVRSWGEPGEAEVGVIAFGSTEGVIREATERARADGFSVAHLHIALLNPLPVEQVVEFAARCKRILVPELNFTGQLRNWLKVTADVEAISYCKDEGVPFMPNEIYQEIVKLSVANSDVSSSARI